MPANEKNNRLVLIIGAGPAGLTAAYELSRADVPCIVLEKDDTVGGISKTVSYKSYLFDIGGHRFFTKIDKIDDLWRGLLGDDFLRRKRLSRIYYEGKFFFYPLKPFNTLQRLGLWNSFFILLSYLYAHLLPSKSEETFEQWVCNRFGRRLYRTFFKTYTEKVWGIPCSEIRAEWAAQRIKGLSFLSVLRNAILISRNSNGNKRCTIKTLIDEFDYPRLGPGMMWQTMADAAKQNQTQLWLESVVEGILWSGSRVYALEVKREGQIETVGATDFISSMPLREAILKLKPNAPEEVREAAGALKYRDFLIVVLIVNRQEVFPDNWIYVHDPAVKMGRIQNFKNWSPDMVPDPGKTCLGLEYFCFEGDSLWTAQDNDLIELGTGELQSLGLVNANEVEEGCVVRMPKAYPIYDSTYEHSLEVIRKFLAGLENFQVMGRNGMHRYNNQDHSMLTAMLAVENLSGAGHDLWTATDEQEYCEEVKEERTDKLALEKFVTNTFARMDKLGFATAVGSACGILILIATLFFVFIQTENGGSALQLLGQYLPGYTVTVKGAFIGMVCTFLWGFIFGWLFAYLRNLVIAFYIYLIRRKLEMMTFRDFWDNF